MTTELVNILPRHTENLSNPEQDFTLYAGRQGYRVVTKVWRTLRRHPFPWDTWCLLAAQLNGRLAYCYAYRGYLWSWKLAHRRCANCTLAYMSHVDGKCMFDTTMFKWQECVTKGHRKIINIITGESLWL